jgi:hypothetical protein
MTTQYPYDLYVYSAVPPGANRLIRKYGLLSGIETIDHPDVLRAARPDVKQRKAFVKKVKDVAKSERPYSVQGPSVFFTMPDPAKITKKHFIKQWDLQPVRINLGRLVADYPDTVVWGAELLPYDKAWRDMSDEEFDEVMVDMGYASWEDFAAERSRELTLDEVYDFTQMRPEDLWEHYPKSDAGKMYASNVPHAFIITPMGHIPYEYIEYVDAARSNPLTGKAPTFTSDAQGYLRNPLSDSGISWWHVTSPYTRDIERFGFRPPTYFASYVDSLCGIAETLNRADPVTLYDVKLRIGPKNLLSPQTIFKDWLHSFNLTREDDEGNEWDAEGGDPNPWFSSPEFVDTLTPLGKRFYYDIATAECSYSTAEIMSLVCECSYRVFDVLKNLGPNLFEDWCRRNNIYGWLEAEFRDGGWVRDISGMWMPEDGFNIGVWDTSRIEITEAFPDIMNCEDTWDASAVVGRRNPLGAPTRP